MCELIIEVLALCAYEIVYINFVCHIVLIWGLVCGNNFGERRLWVSFQILIRKICFIKINCVVVNIIIVDQTPSDNIIFCFIDLVVNLARFYVAGRNHSINILYFRCIINVNVFISFAISLQLVQLNASATAQHIWSSLVII